MHKLSRDLEALGRMRPAELRSAWRETFKQAAPQLSPDLLSRALAYRLQERQHGGLTSSVRLELSRLTRLVARTGECLPANHISLKPGTRLVREWNGRTLNVLVCDEGFELDGRQYASLTQIAHHVTGTRWSGPRFFGLKSRKAPPSRRKIVNG
jgi:hypothetical protein